MNTTHDQCAGSGFEAEIGVLAASTINSFDRLAAQCRDAGYSGRDEVLRGALVPGTMQNWS